MKKSHLRPVNKEAIKAAALLAAASVLGYHMYTKHHTQAVAAARVNQFQTDLVEYRNDHINDQVKVDEQTGEETITIAEKVPEIAIFYHTDGRISILYHRTVYSLTTLMKEEPALATNIQDYITATRDQVLSATDNTLSK